MSGRKRQVDSSDRMYAWLWDFLTASLTALRLISDGSDHSRGYPVDLSYSREGSGHEQAPGTPPPDCLGPRAGLHEVLGGELSGGKNSVCWWVGGWENCFPRRSGIATPSSSATNSHTKWDWEEGWEDDLSSWIYPPASILPRCSSSVRTCFRRPSIRPRGWC